MNARFVRKLTLVALFLSALCATMPAFAQSEDDERGRAHFLAGSSYYKAGDYEAAAREFQEAFDLSGRPEMLLNLSASHHKAGNLDAAIAALELLLERYPKTSRRPEAQEKLAELRQEREAKQAEAAPAPPAPIATPSEPTAPTQQEIPAEEKPSQAPTEPSSGRKIGLATWIVGGAAVALGGAALATGLLAHNRYQDCEDGSCAQSEIDGGKTMALVSTVSSFAALGAAGASVTMYFLEVGVKEDKAVALVPAWSKDAVGLSLRTQF